VTDADFNQLSIYHDAGSSGDSLGSSRGSLAVTPDHKTAVRGLNPAISLAYCTVNCQSLDGQPSGMILHCRLSSEEGQKRINTKEASGPPKTIMVKRTLFVASDV
jgi:hypothetical protein